MSDYGPFRHWEITYNDKFNSTQCKSLDYVRCHEDLVDIHEHVLTDAYERINLLIRTKKDWESETKLKFVINIKSLKDWRAVWSDAFFEVLENEDLLFDQVTGIMLLRQRHILIVWTASDRFYHEILGKLLDLYELPESAVEVQFTTGKNQRERGRNQNKSTKGGHRRNSSFNSTSSNSQPPPQLPPVGSSGSFETDSTAVPPVNHQQNQDWQMGQMGQMEIGYNPDKDISNSNSRGRQNKRNNRRNNGRNNRKNSNNNNKTSAASVSPAPLEIDPTLVITGNNLGEPASLSLSSSTTTPASDAPAIVEEVDTFPATTTHMTPTGVKPEDMDWMRRRLDSEDSINVDCKEDSPSKNNVWSGQLTHQNQASNEHETPKNIPQPIDESPARQELAVRMDDENTMTFAAVSMSPSNLPKPAQFDKKFSDLFSANGEPLPTIPPTSLSPPPTRSRSRQSTDKRTRSISFNTQGKNGSINTNNNTSNKSNNTTNNNNNNNNNKRDRRRGGSVSKKPALPPTSPSPRPKHSRSNSNVSTTSNNNRRPSFRQNDVTNGTDNTMNEGMGVSRSPRRRRKGNNNTTTLNPRGTSNSSQRNRSPSKSKSTRNNNTRNNNNNQSNSRSPRKRRNNRDNKDSKTEITMPLLNGGEEEPIITLSGKRRDRRAFSMNTTNTRFDEDSLFQEVPAALSTTGGEEPVAVIQQTEGSVVPIVAVNGVPVLETIEHESPPLVDEQGEVFDYNRVIVKEEGERENEEEDNTVEEENTIIRPRRASVDMSSKASKNKVKRAKRKNKRKKRKNSMNKSDQNCEISVWGSIWMKIVGALLCICFALGLLFFALS
eukprot:TRINITY_DN777797_c0_g1_i1.p1 TRINITY_DN777797_c0_g1~~TRINITY_DN777797_c0_g1_i1.p1  ORF type:complete len:832 (-),score=261.76 TRINITY_DN777797_c0_g1_i1:410-2905(-)